MCRSFVNRRRRFGLTQMQVCQENEDDRSYNAKCEVRVNDGEQPIDRAGISGVVIGCNLPDQRAHAQASKCRNVPAERGDSERVAAARTNEIV